MNCIYEQHTKSLAEKIVKHPYENLIKTQYWSTGVKEPLNSLEKLELPSIHSLISIGENVCSIGSCFAQHIGKNLISRNYKYLVSKYSGKRKESFGLGNVYTPTQFRQWLEFSMGLREWSSDTIYINENKDYFDYLLPHVSAFKSQSSLIEYRTAIAEEIKCNLEIANTLIFTLGLTEQWETRKNEAIGNCPGTLIGKFEENKYKFKNLSFSEIIDELSKINNLIKRLNPKIKIIFTVSPVPLTATYNTEHILVANMTSKSTLRAAVIEYVKEVSNTAYFPSFELITHNPLDDWRFQKNLRSVSETGVQLVMEYGFGEKLSRAHNAHNINKNLEKIEIYCEEEKLESFNRNLTLNINSNPNKTKKLLLIGDSHMGKLSKALNRQKVDFIGGQVMNGKGFSDGLFRLDEEKIFFPEEDEKSSIIWQQLFKHLSNNESNFIIVTNVGFQAHRTIAAILNDIKTPVSTLEDIEEYYRNKNQCLKILEKFTGYGKVAFIEDPNFWPIHPNNEYMTQAWNIGTLGRFFSEKCRGYGIDYLSFGPEIIQEIYKNSNSVSAAVSDIIHGSDLYYDKLAQRLITKYLN